MAVSLKTARSLGPQGPRQPVRLPAASKLLRSPAAQPHACAAPLVAPVGASTVPAGQEGAGAHATSSGSGPAPLATMATKPSSQAQAHEGPLLPL